MLSLNGFRRSVGWAAVIHNRTDDDVEIVFITNERIFLQAFENYPEYQWIKTWTHEPHMIEEQRQIFIYSPDHKEVP